MRKIPGMLLALMLLLCNVTAYADKARGISTSADETFHMGHLYRHLNDVTCRVTGNYIKVRTDAKSNAKLVGHLEQADEFVLLELDGDFACVRVLNAHETSPDSWNGMEGWVTAAYVDCTCSETEYREGSGVVGRLSGAYFPIGMPSEWYFCSGAGGWDTQLSIHEDGSFEGYYHDWDGGITASSHPRGALQECRFEGRFCSPERISMYEYRLVVDWIEQEGVPGEEFIRDEMLVTITRPYGIGEGDTLILYLPGTPLNRIPPAYHEWAYVTNDEWETHDFALYNMTDAFGWNAN